MRDSIRAVAWLSFLATAYLMCAAALAPWISLPQLGSVGFTLVFVLFAVSHCLELEGVPRTVVFFTVSAVVSYLMEEIGVRTGVIYGAYHYSDQLGAKLGHVPVIIPLAWFMMIYPSWRVAGALAGDCLARPAVALTVQAALAALVMTAWDMVMDPGMAAAGNWTWEQGGAYFGVPAHNYVGWLATTFPVYWCTGWLWQNVRGRAGPTCAFGILPIILYALFAIRYIATNSIPALQLVALFAMGLPALI